MTARARARASLSPLAISRWRVQRCSDGAAGTQSKSRDQRRDCNDKSLNRPRLSAIIIGRAHGIRSEMWGMDGGAAVADCDRNVEGSEGAIGAM